MSVEVITASEVAQADTERKSLLAKMAGKYGLEPNRMMSTLKATAFKGDVTNEQMAALLIVADQHNLNPWCREIYAFPSQQGIVPMVSVDGWARIINEHPQFDGMDFEQDDEKCTCKMYRKDRTHPIVVTEYKAECERNTGPWKTHPKRMLRHKAMIQCARLAFSFAGIFDPDEAERIVAAEAETIDVTPHKEEGEEISAETDMGPAKIGAVKMRKIVEGLNAAATADDPAAYKAIRDDLSNAEWLLVWKQLRSYERSAIKKVADKAKLLPPPDVAGWSVELLNRADTPDGLLAAWTTVQDAFAANDVEVPADIETIYQDRKQTLAVP